MTIITIYPFFGGLKIANILKATVNKGFTIIKSDSLIIDKDLGTESGMIETSETLTTGQKTIMTNLFNGTALIEFT